MSVPTREIACSSKFSGVLPFKIARCSSILACTSAGRYNSPEFIKGIHIKRKVINLTLIVCNRRIGITVKLCKLIYIIPDLLIRSMEDMSTILMNLNSFLFTSIDITRDMISFFNNFYFFPFKAASWEKTAPKRPAPTTR